LVETGIYYCGWYGGEQLKNAREVDEADEELQVNNVGRYI
jgi:hypothetical protein